MNIVTFIAINLKFLTLCVSDFYYLPIFNSRMKSSIVKMCSFSIYKQFLGGSFPLTMAGTTYDIHVSIGTTREGKESGRGHRDPADPLRTS